MRLETALSPISTAYLPPEPIAASQHLEPGYSYLLVRLPHPAAEKLISESPSFERDIDSPPALDGVEKWPILTGLDATSLRELDALDPIFPQFLPCHDASPPSGKLSLT